MALQVRAILENENLFDVLSLSIERCSTIVHTSDGQRPDKQTTVAIMSKKRNLHSKTEYCYF